MSVRRLHHEQPPSFDFSDENLAWADVLLTRYPPERKASAVIPLLWRAQEQEGWVSEPMLRAIADMLGMPYIRVLEIATFYTMFLLQPVGARAHIQVCGTTPCMLRGARDLLDICRTRIAPHALEVSADGNFSWEEAECLGACVNAPMVQVRKDTYEDLTPETFNALLDAFARGETPRPGPQVDRFNSEPEGAPTTLIDPGLYDGSINADFRRRREAAESEKAQAEAAAKAAEGQPAAVTAPTGAGSASPASPAAADQEKAKPSAESPAEKEIARGTGPEAGDKPQAASADALPAGVASARAADGVRRGPQGKRSETGDTPSVRPTMPVKPEG